MTSLLSSLAASSSNARPMPSMRPESSSKSCVVMCSSAFVLAELYRPHVGSGTGEPGICLDGGFTHRSGNFQ